MANARIPFILDNKIYSLTFKDYANALGAVIGGKKPDPVALDWKLIGDAVYGDALDSETALEALTKQAAGE